MFYFGGPNSGLFLVRIGGRSEVHGCPTGFVRTKLSTNGEWLSRPILMPGHPLPFLNHDDKEGGPGSCDDPLVKYSS